MQLQKPQCFPTPLHYSKNNFQRSVQIRINNNHAGLISFLGSLQTQLYIYIPVNLQIQGWALKFLCMQYYPKKNCHVFIVIPIFSLEILRDYNIHVSFYLSIYPSTSLYPSIYLKNLSSSFSLTVFKQNFTIYN